MPLQEKKTEDSEFWKAQEKGQKRVMRAADCEGMRANYTKKKKKKKKTNRL